MKINDLIKKFKLKSKIKNNFEIRNFSSLDIIKNNSIFFYENNDLNFLKKKLRKNKNGVVILNKKLYKSYFSNKILSTNPRYTFFKICDFLTKKKVVKEKFLNKKKIGKNCVIDNSAKIGKNVQVGNNVKIGANTIINNCSISDNTIISDNCVIGNTGFGFIKYKKKIFTNNHYGNVEIKKNVFIGPFTNIERGHIDDTLLKDNVKIDAFVQIGHNSEIDTGTFVTAGTIVSGNVRVGKNVWIGPKSSIKEKTIIGNDCLIGIGSNVVSNLKSGKTYYGNPAKIKK